MNTKTYMTGGILYQHRRKQTPFKMSSFYLGLLQERKPGQLICIRER